MPDLLNVCDGHPMDADTPAPSQWNGRATFHDPRCPDWCQAGHTGTVPRPPYSARVNTVLSTQVEPSETMPGCAWVHPKPVKAQRAQAPAPVDQALEMERALAGVQALLRLMGEDPTRPGLQDTPARVVKAYLELADAPGDPDALLGKVFHDVDSRDSEMIAVPGIAFVSLCEHHLLPFTGTATVAYIPRPGGVVGLSKIPRLVQHYARRPQVQERLTTQIVDALVDRLQPLGAAVVIESTHACMALRGVRAQEATMVTSALRGRFLENPPTRAEFMALATRGRS